MLRRSLLVAPALALLSVQALAATVGMRRPAPPRVAAGTDREARTRSIGVSDTTYKVLTSDTGGDLFVPEQANRRKGGPSRHLHHRGDELFFCLEGEYVVEIDTQRVALMPGDCVLELRGIPHAWAFSGSMTGRLLISFAPAGKMEAFFAQRGQRGIRPGAYASSKEDAALLHEFGMELAGPPIPAATL